MLVHSVPRLCDVHFYSIEKYCDGQLFTGASSVLCRHTAGPHSYTAAQIDARLSRDVYYRYGLVTNCTRHIITCGTCVVRGGARRLADDRILPLTVRKCSTRTSSVHSPRSLSPPPIYSPVSQSKTTKPPPSPCRGSARLMSSPLSCLARASRARAAPARHLEGDALGALDEA